METHVLVVTIVHCQVWSPRHGEIGSYRVTVWTVGCDIGHQMVESVRFECQSLGVTIVSGGIARNLEEAGAMAWVSLYIYYWSAATVGMWIINWIFENVLWTCKLPLVYKLCIISGTMNSTGTGIPAGYVDTISTVIDIRGFSIWEETNGDRWDSEWLMVVNIP